MSLGACIPELLAQGKIPKREADKADRAYKRHYEALRGAMGDEAAAAEATSRALGELEYDAALKKRQASLMVLKQKKLDAGQDAAVAKGTNGHRYAADVLREVEVATERLTNQAHDAIFAFIQKHRRNLLGNPKDKTGLVDVVDELHGKSTGNEQAASFAKAIGDTFERLRLAFNREGGDIGHRADFGMPHSHDPLKVRDAGFEQWRADILNSIDVDRMVDPATGGRFTPDRLEEFMAASYENIRTNGGTMSKGGGGIASRMLANRRSDHRFFVFKDGKAWLDYAAKYGDGNPFEAILSHIHGMARDIAFMEKMGPNPAATWRRLTDRADNIAKASDTVHTGALNGTSRAQLHADQMWRYMNGDLTVPVIPEGDGWGAWAGRKALSGLHGTRDLLTAALLGSAQITSIADINTNIFARKMNGLAASNVFMGYLKQLNPLDPAHRRFAVYLGAGERDATRTMASLARWFGETNGPRFTQVLADDALRITGMNKFFEAGRRAFISDYFRSMGADRALGFADLPEWRRAAFERHGITPEDWDVIRAAEPTRFRGEDYVDHQQVAKANPELADRMLDAILRETRSAVLEADAETQAVSRWGRPGTIKGEFGANVLQFKSFPLALLMDQAKRIGEINERKGTPSAVIYGVSFVAGMTMFGAIAMQLKEIAKGKDMRDMTTPDFWLDALVQGGGVGVLGDLFGSFRNDRVDGLAQYLGGPVISFTSDAVKTVKSALEKDKQTGERGRKFGQQASRLARRYTPGTTTWYARAALDRLLWDELQERMDPDFYDHQRRLEDATRRNGQDFYWRPGDSGPSRMPEMGEAPAE